LIGNNNYEKFFFKYFLLNFLIFINLTGSLFSNTIQPGPLSYEEIQKALILSKPGDIIKLGEGYLNLRMVYL
jgi:hypothetical protein